MTIVSFDKIYDWIINAAQCEKIKSFSILSDLDKKLVVARVIDHLNPHDRTLGIEIYNALLREGAKKWAAYDEARCNELLQEDPMDPEEFEDWLCSGFSGDIEPYPPMIEDVSYQIMQKLYDLKKIE